MFISLPAPLAHAEEPGWPKAKLCWSNYALQTNGGGAAAGTYIGNGYTNDQCWTQCGTTGGCIGYQFDWNDGGCYLVTAWNNGLILAENGMPAIYTGLSIYGMGNNVCPDKDIEYAFAN